MLHSHLSCHIRHLMVLPFPLDTCCKASAWGYEALCLHLQSPQGLHFSLCPCGDIEVAGGNVVGWNRFVIAGCHPELCLDLGASPWDALSGCCPLGKRETGVAGCQGLCWDCKHQMCCLKAGWESRAIVSSNGQVG